MDVVVDGELPATPSWRRSVRDYIVERSNWDGGSVVRDDGTSIALALRAGDPALVRPERLGSEALRLNEFAHVGVVARRNGDTAVNPVFIRVHSEKPDRILNSIHKDLRSKKDQFSATRPAVLCCYLPEIASFEDLKTGALANMTLDFFTKHAPPHIVGVSYLSDAQALPQPFPGGVAYASASDSLDFSNPAFDKKRYGSVRLPGAGG